MSFDLTGVFPMAKSVLSGIVIVYVLLLAAERIEAAVGREEREVASHRLPGCAEMACYSLLQLSGTDVRLMEVSERFRQRVPDFDPTKVSILEWEIDCGDFASVDRGCSGNEGSAIAQIEKMHAVLRCRCIFVNHGVRTADRRHPHRVDTHCFCDADDESWDCQRDWPTESQISFHRLESRYRANRRDFKNVQLCGCE